MWYHMPLFVVLCMCVTNVLFFSFVLVASSSILLLTLQKPHFYAYIENFHFRYVYQNTFFYLFLFIFNLPKVTSIYMHIKMN
jgi:hypothetical protein